MELRLPVPAELVRRARVGSGSLYPAAHLTPLVFEPCGGDCGRSSGDTGVPFVPSVPVVPSVPLELIFFNSSCELTEDFLIALFGGCACAWGDFGGCACAVGEGGWAFGKVTLLRRRDPRWRLKKLPCFFWLGGVAGAVALYAGDLNSTPVWLAMANSLSSVNSVYDDVFLGPPLARREVQDFKRESGKRLQQEGECG